MKLADAWDRFFWSVMIVIFVGLLWMKFLQPYAACEGPGLIVSLIIGGVYFYRGYARAKQEKKKVKDYSVELKEK